MLQKFLSIVTIVAFSTFLVSCNDVSTSSTTTSDTSTMSSTTDAMSDTMNNNMNETGVMVGGANMVPSKNIVENAANSTEHTTLVAAVKAGGLAETLSGAGPFTVFAPTHSQFD